VLDIHGNPPKGRLFTICGSACVRGDMAEDGTFVFDKDYCFKKLPPLTRPVFFYHGADAYSDLAYDFVPADATVVDAQFDKTLYVVAVEEMTKLTVNPEVAQTLSDSAGFELSFQAGTVDLGFAEWIAVKEVPKDKYPPIAGVETLAALYALHPGEVTFTAPAKVMFPNTTKLASGSAVDIFVISSGVGDVGPYPGTLGRVAGGLVTADGASIVSNEGEGLMNIAWAGYRAAK
jgi:hypothetical protein